MIARKKPLKRSGPPQRRTWLKRQARQIKRLGRPRFRGYVRNEEYRLWVRQEGCVVGRECFGIVEFAHVVSRARGGEDEANGCGLCSQHHREQHRRWKAQLGLQARRGGARAKRRSHHLTVSRDNPVSKLWRCRCGAVVTDKRGIDECIHERRSA